MILLSINITSENKIIKNYFKDFNFIVKKYEFK